MNGPASAGVHRQRQNPVLVPGSLLSRRDLWQQVANSLPDGEMLVVLPAGESPQQRALAAAAIFLQAGGHPVTTIRAETFASNAIQAELPFR